MPPSSHYRPRAIAKPRFDTPSAVPRLHALRHRGQLRPRRNDPPLDLPGQGILAEFVPALVELPLVAVDVLLGGVVGGVVGAGAEPQVPGLVGLRLLGVLDERDGLVGQVPGQVVAVLGQVRLVGVVVVLGQVGYQLLVSPPTNP